VVRLKIDRKDLLSRIKSMKESGYSYLVKITAVDYKDHLTALYFIRDISKNKEELLEVDILSNDAWLPTIIKEHTSADWYEREMSEMFDIKIKGRKSGRLLLEKWDGLEGPLRKGFAWGEEYKQM
jgi:NADH:ubiquinone oxidoreductase subunit C